MPKERETERAMADLRVLGSTGTTATARRATTATVIETSTRSLPANAAAATTGSTTARESATE